MSNYKLVSSTYDLSFRSGANTLFPRIVVSGNPKIVNGYVLKGAEVLGDNLITLSADVKDPNGVVVGWAGDKWLEATMVAGLSVVKGYVAHINKGVVMATLTVLTPPVVVVTPSPTGGDITGATIVLHYADGTSSLPQDLIPAPKVV